MRLRPCSALMLIAPLVGCAMGTGIVPYGPGTFLVSEMRAPVRGGAIEAERAALAEADDFCRAQGRSFAPITMAPGGYPNGRYGPTHFTAIFHCVPGSADQPNGAS